MDRRQKSKRADMEYKRKKVAIVSIKDRDDGADMAVHIPETAAATAGNLSDQRGVRSQEMR